MAQQERITLADLASEALQRHLARRILERFKREGSNRRRGMTDDEVDNFVERSIHEHRDEERDSQNKEHGR